MQMIPENMYQKKIHQNYGNADITEHIKPWISEITFIFTNICLPIFLKIGLNSHAGFATRFTSNESSEGSTLSTEKF